MAKEMRIPNARINDCYAFSRVRRHASSEAEMPGVATSIVFRKSLANQRALPDAQQQFFELAERLGAQFVAPLALDVAKNVVDPGVCGASAPGQADDPRTAFVWLIRSDEISERFEAAEQLVDRLLAHAGALREHAGTDAVGAGKPQHRHVRKADFAESHCVQFSDNPAMDRL